MNAATASLILMVVTSHGSIDEQHATGLWLEEFSIPYQIFTEAGYEVTVASPKGGKAPVDPRSLTDETKPENAEAALKVLEDTVRLAEVDLNRYDAVFFPGGHGTMFDLPKQPAVRKTVEHFVGGDRPAAFICHGPAALVGARDQDGEPLIKGRRVTGFTNEEERAVELDDAMPFLLETRLKALGGTFRGAAAFSEHVVVDGRLVTGQNPASSEAAARELLALLRDKSDNP